MPKNTSDKKPISFKRQPLVLLIFSCVSFLLILFRLIFLQLLNYESFRTKNNSRKAFVAGANEKVKDRLAKFGVEGIIETRKEALETALNEIA